MERRTLAILALCAVTLALIAGLGFRAGVFGPADQTPSVGGPFQLVDQAGRPATEKVLKGKWSAVFFGFTYCPEACPTTLFALGGAQDRLGPKAANFQTVLISVDPARDTPAAMARYLSNEAFPKNAIGLTGTKAQTDAAAKAYHVFHEKVGEGADYTINHSTVTYLMNPRGRFACVLPYGLTPEQLADRIGRAMAQGNRATSC